MNSFIVFKSLAHFNLPRIPGLSGAGYSRVIAYLWRTTPEVIKYQAQILSGYSNRIHRQRYPNYQYSPRRVTGQKRQLLRICQSYIVRSNVRGFFEI
jgi:hypothetical protein